MEKLIKAIFPTAQLTGSRYFGTNHSHSDWDFFVASEDGNPEKMISLGFRKLSNPIYNDESIAEVW